MSSFVQQLRGLKLKEVSPFVRKYASEHWTPQQLRTRAGHAYADYKTKYVDTGSPKPLFDTMLALFVVGYALSWPHEYAHYKAEQQAKLEGKPAPH